MVLSQISVRLDLSVQLVLLCLSAPMCDSLGGLQTTSFHLPLWFSLAKHQPDVSVPVPLVFDLSLAQSFIMPSWALTPTGSPVRVISMRVSCPLT